MRLYVKIVLLIILMVTGGGVCSSILVSRLMHDAMEEQLEEKGVIVAQALAEHIARQVINGDVLATLEILRKTVEQMEDVEYVYVKGFNGNIFAHSFEGGFPRALAHLPHKMIYSGPHLDRYSTHYGPILQVAYPLIDGMSAHIYIGINESHVLTQIRGTRNRIMGLTLSIALLCVLLGLGVTHRITHPLALLAQSMQAFGKGKIEDNIDLHSGTWEVAELRRSFNQMITERKRAEQMLRKARDELELRVEERTAELSKANEQLKQEIEERKQTEEALRESEERYRALYEFAAEGIIAADIETKKFSHVNPAICRMLGYTEEELNRMSVLDIHPKDSLEYVISEFEAQARGEKVLAPNIPCLRKDGTVIHADISTTNIVLDGRVCNVGFFTDITEKRDMEARLRNAEKMEAIGTLAGGIAHDFNNLLMGIQGNVSLMSFETDPEHPHCDMLKTIEGQVRSGATLTKQLLGYARKGQYDVKSVNLNKLVQGTSETFGRARKQMTIHRELAEDLFAIKADQGQIEQIILSLYVNAADAMPGGGDLTIKTTNVTDQDMKDKPYDAKPGNYVLLTVTDTGSGMDKETQARIFDPFFTTKEMASGRGTGLGMASAYGIVKAHAGYIDVESEKGKGTTFNIYLPATEKRVEKEKAPKVAEQILKGSETVLLVDDEEVVLDVGTKLLEKLGYAVLDAESGRKALELYKDNRDKIAIVVLDMVMPDVGGGEAYDKMKEINPSVKVLLSSGYSIEDAGAKEILDRGCDGFIQKPFNMAELSQSIQRILGKE